MRGSRSTWIRRGWLPSLLTGAVIATSLSLSLAVPAQAASQDGHVKHGRIVSPEPAAWTPQIMNGSVRAITQVGDTVIAGGDFTAVREAGSATDIAKPGLVMFKTGSGSLVNATTTVDGRVEAVQPGVAPGTVWVAGSLKTLNGQVGKIFLINTSTGAVLRRVPANGAVYDLAIAKGQIVAGGTFTTVNGQPRKGLVSLDATTAAVTPFLQVATDGHHNYNGTGAQAGVGPKSFDVSPDESQMAVAGNFKTLDGLPRDQVGVIDLTGTQAVVKADWGTTRFGDACARGAFDSWVRTIQYDPAGEYFAVTGTGGPFGGTLCDTATRWETNATGTSLQPSWIASTGGDTLNGLAVSDASVYIGGHERWLNNVDGADSAAPGAMARPGIASLETQSGVPTKWNPGRHPRGVNTFVMYNTPEGMWIGSDQDYIGYNQYRRPKIAFFPVAGGEELSKGDSGAWPGVISALRSTDQFANFTSDGTTFTDQKSPVAGPANATTRGATLVDGQLYYGSTDGWLHKRSFVNGQLGPDTKLDPYHDPYWDGKDTGSGTTVYTGRVPEIYSQWNSVTGLEYSKGQMYYTKSGDNRVYRSGFSLSSGALEPFTGSTNGTALTGTLTSPGEFVIADGLIYYVNSTNGALLKAPITRSSVGASTQVSGPGIDAIDWRTRALVLRHTPPPPPNQAPTARFDATPDLLTVSVNANNSSDPDGTVANYQWDFGDGGSGSGAAVQHVYDAPGTYSVSLTITDNQGATDTVSKDIKVVEGPSAEFVAQAGFNGNTKSASVALPPNVQAGDTVVVTRTVNTIVPITGPSGATDSWRSLGSAGSSMDTAGYVGTVTKPGEAISFSSDTFVKTDVRVVVYRGVKTNAVSATWVAGASADSAKTPDFTADSDAMTQLGVWSVKTSTPGPWGALSAGTLRSSAVGSGSGAISVAIADKPVTVGAGLPVGGLTIGFGTLSSRYVVGTVTLPDDA